jgi:hypothetical protein
LIPKRPFQFKNLKSKGCFEMAKDKIQSPLRDKDDDEKVETPSLVDLLKHQMKVNQNIEKAGKETAKTPSETPEPAKSQKEGKTASKTANASPAASQEQEPAKKEGGWTPPTQ